MSLVLENINKEKMSNRDVVCYERIGSLMQRRLCRRRVGHCSLSEHISYTLRFRSSSVPCFEVTFFILLIFDKEKSELCGELSDLYFSSHIVKM